MQQHADARSRRGMALGLVLFGHGLVIAALLQVRTSRPHAAVLERLTLIYLPAPERPVTEPPAESPATLPRRAPHRPATDAPAATPKAAPGTAPSTLPAVPRIDWTAEQQREAETQGRDLWKRLSQRCRDAFALHIYPPECHRYVAPEPWEPEEGRFGHEGLLPYVRLGRCVVGLGFWGCAVGKPPPPNGHAFDDLRDPDRPGAVPDNGRYQPSPEPRERLH